ncbi:hypothetical protein [Streptomyces shenzhenensis]|uniref:hypothetical protein n=1 Tax=Streptomyces shenzhenensis TaxID=943815 RepID=UPI00215DB4AA|nr:hypothetical protein [Streptomyces shenzhenensis]
MRDATGRTDDTGATVTATVGSTRTPASPADYRLLLPDGWFRVRIDPEGRTRSIDALVDRKFEGVDNAPHLKRQLRDELLAQATAAYQDGGIELYLSLQQAGPLTIPASLLVTLVRPAPGTAQPDPAELARRLAAGMDAEATVVELAAGTTVRVRRATGRPGTPAPAGAPGSADEVLPSVTVDYQLPVPGTAAYLLLTFSTPLLQIADAMVELFDAVAGSLTWLDGDATHE